MSHQLDSFIHQLAKATGVNLNKSVTYSDGYSEVAQLAPDVETETEISLLVIDGEIDDCTNPLGVGFYYLLSEEAASIDLDHRPDGSRTLTEKEEDVWAACVNLIVRGAVKYRRSNWSMFTSVTSISPQMSFSREKTRVRLTPTGREVLVVEIYPAWKELQTASANHL